QPRLRGRKSSPQSPCAQPISKNRRIAVSSTRRRNEISNAWIASQPELTKKRLFLFICSVIGSGGRACHGAIRPQHRTFCPGGGQGWLFDCHSRAVHTSIGAVSSADPISGAQFASGGVGLRNRETGAIGISGVVTPVKA